MKVQQFLSDIGTDGVETYPVFHFPNHDSTLNLLPKTHQRLLEEVNGLTVFDGYFRIFGSLNAELPSIKFWNSSDLWKFSWNSSITQFLCFGETAWGDQYAYKFEELSQGDSTVYFLDAVTMKAEPIASSFTDFLDTELVRNAQHPYDNYLIAVKERIGPIEPKLQITYSPSLLIVGEEDPDSVQTLLATDNMIFNGDLFRQLGEVESTRAVERVEMINDNEGRNRIEIHFK